MKGIQREAEVAINFGPEKIALLPAHKQAGAFLCFSIRPSPQVGDGPVPFLTDSATDVGSWLVAAASQQALDHYCGREKKSLNYFILLFCLCVF